MKPVVALLLLPAFMIFMTVIAGAASHGSYANFAEPLASYAMNSRDFSFQTSSEQKAMSVSVSDYAVYRYAYASLDGQAWMPVQLSGSVLGGLWLNGSVEGQLSFTASNFSLTQQRLATGRNFMVIYSCSRSGDTWDCHSGWQIWQFNATLAKAYQGTLLANGFENGGVLAPPFTSTRGGALAADAAVAYAGSYSLRMDSTDGNCMSSPDEGQAGAVVPYQYGQAVNFSAFVKAGTGASVAGEIGILCLGDDYKYYGHVTDDGFHFNSFTAGSSWRQVSVTYTCPSWTRYVGVRLSAREPGTLWFDDPVLNVSGGGTPCTPSCSGRECGSDGCFSTCPPGCSGTQTCNTAGQCVAATGYCGDTTCNNGETCSTCEADCGECPTNGFVIYQQWDFENRDVGQYTEEMVREDFDVWKTWMHGENSQIKYDVINGVQTKVAASNFPVPPDGENCYDSPDVAGYRWSGVQIKTFLDVQDTDARCRELYLSWHGKWTNDAVASLGGMKLPGLIGYPEINDATNMDEGFYVTALCQNHDIYAYHYDHTLQAQRVANEGDNVVGWPTLPWASHTYDGTYDFTIVPGTWYAVTQRLVVNSFTNGVPNRDGINEMWVDGHLIYQETGLYLAGHEDMCIDVITVSAFANTCPTEQGEVRMDDVTTWVNADDPTYGNRGLHGIGAILQTPIG